MSVITYTAAGGVVVHEDTVLVLHRPLRRQLRLPKGHVEPGESAEAAALREVIEESGYHAIEVVSDLGHQLVEFKLGIRQVRRDERYFLMRLLDPGARGHPEWEFRPDWLSWDETIERLTFEPEREWVRRARTAHNSSAP